MRGAELDLLNDLVASAVMSIVRFIDDFRRRAEAAPVIPGTVGERDFVPLIRELMEQENRSVPRNVYRRAGSKWSCCWFYNLPRGNLGRWE